MIDQLKKILFSNYYAIGLRNALLIRPNIYKLPQNSNSSISDFFSGKIVKSWKHKLML